jgi:hypothetical protein
MIIREFKLFWTTVIFSLTTILVLSRCTLIDYLRFYVPFKNFSLIWRRHHCRWRTAKFRPMLGTQGLWSGRDLYRATPAVTQDLGFSGLIRRTAPFRRLLRHTRGCGGSILTRILTGTLCGMLKIYVQSLNSAAEEILYFRYYSSVNCLFFKGIVSKLTVKFWMCQKCGKMKDYN